MKKEFTYKQAFKLIKWMTLSAVAIFVICIVYSVATAPSPEEKTKIDAEKQVQFEKAEVKAKAEKKASVDKEIEAQKKQLKREIVSLKKGVSLGDAKTLESLQFKMVLVGAWAVIIDDAAKSEDDEIKKLGAEFKEEVIKTQVREFPKLRKKYVELSKEAMWEHDVDVSSKGSNTETIKFIGVIFARNANIKETHNTIKKALEMYRFKKAEYRWIKHDNDYKTFDVYKGKDSDLMDVKNDK